MTETHNPNQSGLPSPGYSTRHIILAIVLVGVFMCVMDVQIVAIALPSVMQSLGAEIGQVQWIATG
jgi:hypothetical protein